MPSPPTIAPAAAPSRAEDVAPEAGEPRAGAGLIITLVRPGRDRAGYSIMLRRGAPDERR